MFTRTLVIASLIAVSTAAAASPTNPTTTRSSEAAHVTKAVVSGAKRGTDRSLSNAAMALYKCPTDPLHCTSGSIN